MPARLDHLVIGARSLAEGQAWAEERLGVAPGGGGAHPLMGTHNALWKLGDAYIEVLAVDPDGADPGRPRWYGIDLPATVARLAERPRLLTWVIRPAGPIEAVLAGLRLKPGALERHRRDDLHWQLTISPEGETPLAGMLPTMIEWPDGVPAPPERLPANGLGLDALEIRNAPDALGPALAEMQADALVTLHGDAARGDRPGLIARIATAQGIVTLD